MKIHHMMTPLFFLNIIFTSYVAQEVFFVKNTKILANNQEYGECETEFEKENVEPTKQSVRAQEREAKTGIVKGKPAQKFGVTELANWKDLYKQYEQKLREYKEESNPEKRKQIKEEAKVLYYKAKAAKEATR